MTDNYIIVGRDVGEPAFWMDGDNIKEHKPGGPNAGTALTVAYIGHRILELSEYKKPIKQDEYDKTCNAIKHAMKVVPVEPSKLSEADKKKIWDGIEVKLEFEERTKAGANTRVLVVPASGTLAAKAKLLDATPTTNGFPLPLSYPLDTRLRKRELMPMIERLLSRFQPAALSTPSEETESAAEKKKREIEAVILERLKGEMLAYFRKELIESTNFDTDTDDRTILNRQAVLESQVLAFERGVGIYITQMCN